MAGKHKFTRAYKGLDIQKANELNPIPGILGFIINGNRTVEVPNRNGYVYVRLRDNLSEVCQAFNDNVSPVYGLPVLMVRDSTNRTRYKILGRDLGRYQDWGTSSPYLPRHGAQHSFNPPNEGGDVTWIYSRQLMPLSVYPSGSYGAGNVLIYPHTFYRNNTWHYAGGTGTASFLPYKPTGSSARMVLLYIDDNDAPAYVAGSFFNSTYTGTVQVFPYIPSLPVTSGIPLAGIRLVSGTSVILWDNIYDLRPWIVGDSFIPTGTSGGHIIADEGVSLPAQPILDFLGPGVGVRDASGRTEVIISGTSTGGGSLPNTEVGFGNGSSITSSNRFTYNTATDSLTIGNTSPYTSALLSVFGDDVVGNYPYLDIFGLGTAYIPTLETYHARGTYAVRQPALANEQLSAIDFYGYATGSGNYWLRGVSLESFAQYDWHVIGANSYSPAFLRLSAGSTGTSGLTVIGTFDVEKVGLSGDLNVSGTMRPGAFQLRNGANNGYILTSDASGNGTWQTAPAGTPGPPGSGIVVFDNSTYKVSGTAVSFDTGLTVAVTGSVAYINSTASTSSADASVCQGRLTLEAGVPISTTDQTAKTVLYFVPYNGNNVGLYSSSTWSVYSFTGTSLDISGYIANSNYDIWAYANSSVVTLDSTIWVTGTARGTALAFQDGIYVKSGDATRRYIGTIRITAVTGQCEDSVTSRYLWNYYNRVDKYMFCQDGTSHLYNGGLRLWNNSATNNTLSIVIGIQDYVPILEVGAPVSVTGAKYAAVVPYLNGVVHPGSAVDAGYLGIQAVGNEAYLGRPYVLSLNIGYTYIQLYETGNDNSSRFYAMRMSLAHRG